MKRTIIIAIALLTGLSVRAQQDTLPELLIGDRLPYLYYWDTNWIDYKIATYLNGQPIYSIGFRSYHDYEVYYSSRYIGRTCVTAQPMKVIGIASPIRIVNWCVKDTVISHRVPEYFRLYQIEDDSLCLKEEVRWDTATPHYKYFAPYLEGTFGCPPGIRYKLYEAYFEKPVVVHDTFLVGGTTYNNVRYGDDGDTWDSSPWHASTDYACSVREQLDIPYYPPNPPSYYIKYLSPSAYAFSNPNEIPFDTNFFKVEPEDMAVWWHFFAIFDTDFVYEACMGVGTTGLTVEAVDSLGNAALSWDDSGVEQWQVSVAPLGVEADSGMLFETPINYLQLTGLDTWQWYVARVRTQCDSVLYGAWSDSVLFYVPGPYCTMPTGLHVAAVDSASVELAWAAGDATAWNVEVGMVEMGMANGQMMEVENNAIQVNGLPYTDAWYWARVRVVCDTDFWSDWTDTVQFYVSSQHDDTTLALNPVEQYTYLMPNPARDEVTVASSFRVKAVELYAADGKLLQQVEVNAVGTTLSLEGLPAGIYFVRVRTSAGVTTKRLVVE